MELWVESGGFSYQMDCSKILAREIRNTNAATGATNANAGRVMAAGGINPPETPGIQQVVGAAPSPPAGSSSE